MLGNIAGGHHTIDGNLQWLLKYLTDLPHVQANLRRTLYETLAAARREGRLFTAEEIHDARLPYLDAVIEEMLRLNTIPTTREALRDTHVLGHHVPKGTQVFFFPPLGPLLQSAARHAPGAAVAKAPHDGDNGDDGDRRPGLGLFAPSRWLVRKRDGAGLLADDVEFDGAAAPRLGFEIGRAHV